jgi:hypothetical protein
LQIKSAFHKFKEHLSQDSASEGLLWAQFVEKLSDYQFPSRNLRYFMDLLKEEEYWRANIFQTYRMMWNSKVTLGLDQASRLKNMLWEKNSKVTEEKCTLALLGGTDTKGISYKEALSGK